MNNIFEFSDPVLREKYYHIKHKSGLDIYVFPKKMTVSCALLGVNFGNLSSRIRLDNGEEREYPAGTAHFLEHKLFSCEDGTDAFERFAELGADANAYTSPTKTVYLFSCTENVYPGIELLVDFVSHPYFTEENVDRERDIIEQEIRMCNDSPYDRASQDLLFALYGSSPVSDDVCGTAESISKIDPKLLYECYRLFYRYSNMALVVCGDVDPDEVVRAAERGMITENAAESFEVIKITDQSRVHQAYIEKKMPVSRPVFEIGIKDFGISCDPYERMKRDAEMTLLDEILFSRASRLYNELFDAGLIGSSYSYGYSMTGGFGFHSVFGESDDPERVFALVKEYVGDIQKNGISRKDFIRAKRVVAAEFIRDFDSTDDIANSLMGFVFWGAEMFEYRKILEGITVGDLQARLAEDFGDERFALSVIS